MQDYHLAQLNIALLKDSLDSPLLKDFVDNLDRINALAEQSPGFVWRLQTDEGDATALRPFGEDTIVNMSVWTDSKSLHDYVYHSAHIEIMRHKKTWFEHLREAYAVLWWVPAGHQPTIEEAKNKLDTLRREGPTAAAFTFKKPFPKPSETLVQDLGPFDDLCPA